MATARTQHGEAARDRDAAGSGVALARAAEVLLLLESGGATLGELAQRSAVPKATLRGIVNTLVAHDLLAREPGGERYRLGYGWLRLADIRRNQSQIRERALPVMRQIRDAIDETVILSLRVGDRRVHLDYVESTQPVRRIAHPGHEGPLHVGAAGLVLLAGLNDEAVAAYLARANGLDEAARTALQRTVAKIRRDGWAVVSGTVNPDTAAVSAPIRSYDGDSVAALTISCPRDRFTKPLEQDCIAQVRRGAELLSRALGHGR